MNQVILSTIKACCQCYYSSKREWKTRSTDTWISVTALVFIGLHITKPSTSYVCAICSIGKQESGVVLIFTSWHATEISCFQAFTALHRSVNTRPAVFVWADKYKAERLTNPIILEATQLLSHTLLIISPLVMWLGGRPTSYYFLCLPRTPQIKYIIYWLKPLTGFWWWMMWEVLKRKVNLKYFSFSDL